MDVKYQSKSGGDKIKYETSLFPTGNTATDTYKVKGDKVIGELSFQNTGKGSFTSDGETYEFINPGSQSFKINAKGSKKAAKTIYIDLEKVPYAAPDLGMFLQPSDDFLSFAANNDTLA